MAVTAVCREQRSHKHEQALFPVLQEHLSSTGGTGKQLKMSKTEENRRTHSQFALEAQDKEQLVLGGAEETAFPERHTRCILKAGPNFRGVVEGAGSGTACQPRALGGRWGVGGDWKPLLTAKGNADNPKPLCKPLPARPSFTSPRQFLLSSPQASSFPLAISES